MDAAYRLFAVAHLPLFAFILWQIQVPGLQIGFNMFCSVHAGLHFALYGHPHLDFNNVFSAIWIYGVVPLAVFHLMLIGTL